MAMIKMPNVEGKEVWLNPSRVNMIAIGEGPNGIWMLSVSISGYHEASAWAGTEAEMRVLARQITGEADQQAWLERHGLGDLEDMREAKDGAYEERNRVVALLAAVFPSGIARTAIPGWDEAWHGCVYIDLPTGQASWHYHDSQAHLFAHLPPYKGTWDGHTTEEKYARVADMSLWHYRQGGREPTVAKQLAGEADQQRYGLAELACNICGDLLPHDRCDPSKVGHMSGPYIATFPEPMSAIVREQLAGVDVSEKAENSK